MLLLKLKDGRRLAYIKYGDPNGKTLFHLHGWPGSRFSAQVLDKPAKRLGIRVIGIDRPGFGLSDPQPERKLLDFPKDLLVLADHLKVKTFSVLGVSGGGPYGYACAFAIPQNRLMKVAVVAGLGPVYDNNLYSKLTTMLKLSYWSVQKAPVLFTACAWLQRFFIRNMPGSLSLYHLFRLLSGSDKKIFLQRDFQDLMILSMKEAFRQGVKGPVVDWDLYVRPWGFRLKDIKRQVLIWHGKQDRSVPYSIGEFCTSQLKDKKFFTYQSSGHYLLYEKGHEILKALINGN